MESNKKYKLVFVTGCLDHISLPLCLEFEKEYGSDFIFISTLPFPESRREIGYGTFDNKYNFVFKSYLDKEHFRIAKRIISEADVVIYGTCEDSLLIKRFFSNKYTFKMSERFYKTKTTQKNWLRRKIGAFIHYKRFPNKNHYILCMGGFVSNDLDKINIFKGKRLVWGYFTETTNKTFDELVSIKNNNKFNILWVGRFIDIKHPFMPIFLAKYLQDNLVKDFTIKMVGYGPLLDSCKEKAKQLGVSNHLIFTGPLSLFEKENEMNKSNIFVFTSDEREGWGAVVNESMGSACGIVASKQAGSPSTLIKDGINGFLFDVYDQGEFNKKVFQLINDEKLLKYLQQNAFNDSKTLWTSAIAAKRLISIIKSLQEKGTFNYEISGPCSEAKSI